jgi:hypothetical protein
VSKGQHAVCRALGSATYMCEGQGLVSNTFLTHGQSGLDEILIGSCMVAIMPTQNKPAFSTQQHTCAVRAWLLWMFARLRTISWAAPHACMLLLEMR